MSTTDTQCAVFPLELTKDEFFLLHVALADLHEKMRARERFIETVPGAYLRVGFVATDIMRDIKSIIKKIGGPKPLLPADVVVAYDAPAAELRKADRDGEA